MCRLMDCVNLLCWNCSSGARSDKSRLHAMTLKQQGKMSRELRRTGIARDQKLIIARLFPLYGHLRIVSESTKAACWHWTWRGQEGYLSWKQQECPHYDNDLAQLRAG